MDLKKTVSSVLVLTLILSLVACTGKQSSEKDMPTETVTTVQGRKQEDGKVQVEGMLWGVKPLEKKTKLTVSYLTNSTPELSTYIANLKGWLEACNVEVELVYFAGGPAQMEASRSWDVGTTGIGGVITGIINYNVKVLAIAGQDKGIFQAFFARKDSQIVLDGKGYGKYEEVYGKPESWKGLDILTAVGTTNQYALYQTLASLGLELSDVNIINMDIAAATTAFLVGEGDVAGVQGTMIFDEVYQNEDSDYVMVSSDQIVGSGLDVNYVATEDAWNSKREAIEVWLELALMAGEWANHNLDEAAEIMVEMYREDGYEITFEVSKKTINENPFTTLEENYRFFTEKEETGERVIIEDNTYRALEGYIVMGNYSQEQSEALFSANCYISDAVEKIYESQK